MSVSYQLNVLFSKSYILDNDGSQRFLYALFPVSRPSSISFNRTTTLSPMLRLVISIGSFSRVPVKTSWVKPINKHPHVLFCQKLLHELNHEILAPFAPNSVLGPSTVCTQFLCLSAIVSFSFSPSFIVAPAYLAAYSSRRLQISKGQSSQGCKSFRAEPLYCGGSWNPYR